MSLIHVPTKQALRDMHAVIKNLPAPDRAEIVEDLGLDEDYQDFLKARRQWITLIAIACLALVLYIVLMIGALNS